ncbi:MAG: type II secretion system GspH family protein [Kiritimatiellae bacterium]|nr:type II secretion system GspH family protein [Kiritimatiellia bacterium]
MKKAGFSLIELLVVISILAIVGAFSAPAWRDARDQAHRAVCSSNLQQLYSGYMMYLSDHNGELFPFKEVVDGQDLWYWGLETRKGAEGQRVIDRSKARLAPYLGESSIETCPSFPYKESFTKQKFDVSTYGYGLNHYLFSNSGVSRNLGIVNYASVTRPGETIIWGDSAQVNTFQAPASAKKSDDRGVVLPFALGGDVSLSARGQGAGGDGGWRDSLVFAKPTSETV